MFVITCQFKKTTLQTFSLQQKNYTNRDTKMTTYFFHVKMRKRTKNNVDGSKNPYRLEASSPIAILVSSFTPQKKQNGFIFPNFRDEHFQ